MRFYRENKVKAQSAAMSKRISAEKTWYKCSSNDAEAHFNREKKAKNAFGNDAEVHFHGENKVKTLASPYKDIREPLGACLGPDFRKKYGVPKTAFPFLVSFSKLPVSAILRTAGFPGGQ